MPLPPAEPWKYICPICHWKGATQTSDVLISPIDRCPECHSKLKKHKINPLENLFQLLKR